jgi:hypothetical protein
MGEEETGQNKRGHHSENHIFKETGIFPFRQAVTFTSWWEERSPSISKNLKFVR